MLQCCAALFFTELRFWLAAARSLSGGNLQCESSSSNSYSSLKILLPYVAAAALLAFTFFARVNAAVLVET